jgi:hypothetical protein
LFLGVFGVKPLINRKIKAFYCRRVSYLMHENQHVELMFCAFIRILSPNGIMIPFKHKQLKVWEAFFIGK